MIKDFPFFISEAFIGMRRSGLMIFISIATITVSLLVLGVFLLLSLNLSHFGRVMASKLEIRVFLRSELTRAEITQFYGVLSNVSSIKTVDFVDREEAWDQFQSNYVSMQLSDIFGQNPLPHSFRIVLENSKMLPQTVSYIRSYSTQVEDVVYGGVIAERLELFTRIIHWFGIVLVGMLTFATLLIVVNTIRLTVIARQSEIFIMQMVGATNRFIRWPFIIEGIVIGCMGSLISVGILHLGYSILGEKVTLYIPYFPLVVDMVEILKIFGAVMIVGTLLGFLGAFISVTRSLKLKKV
jgi:cell division transport system permease protein